MQSFTTDSSQGIFVVLQLHHIKNRKNFMTNNERYVPSRNCFYAFLSTHTYVRIITHPRTHTHAQHGDKTLFQFNLRTF